MKIVVLVKYVPDIEIGYEFTGQNTLDRSGAGLLSQLDEHPLEEARQLAEALDDVEVIALTLGPDDADEAVRRALQMGADAAFHVSDPAVAGSDAGATALVLAKAITHIGDVDLILTGAESADSGTRLVPVKLAALLGIPALTGASSLAVQPGGGAVTIERDEDAATLTLSAPLPALVSVTDKANEPAYPSAKAVMLARRKPVDELDLADLGVDASLVGAGAARVAVGSVTPNPPRAGGRKIPADGPDAIGQFIGLLREAGLV
ncbi:MAG: electron transfer flavoprotein subunit beta/FixA family protein [Bifidobacteriaceae bacterium]|jgi:electron transfer flavoprotein beta subunit|nr:electron transfer flavoprotein subunit beta/FixA family protein [Bifidobacteriaceae bacterium]